MPGSRPLSRTPVSDMTVPILPATDLAVQHPTWQCMGVISPSEALAPNGTSDIIVNNRLRQLLQSGVSALMR